jgi:hypothetical protein
MAAGQEKTMPIRVLEELTSRKKEKIATFLTFESIVAVLITFLPLFLLSGSWPLLIRVPVCAAAAALGYGLTLEVQGLALYERLLWIGRGLVRLRLHGGTITPEDLPGAVLVQAPDAVLALDGPIASVSRGERREGGGHADL